MENAIVRTNEKIVWYSKEDKIMSFHFVVNYTKKIFQSSRDMFRFVLGLIDVGFKIMWGGDYERISGMSFRQGNTNNIQSYEAKP